MGVGNVGGKDPFIGMTPQEQEGQMPTEDTLLPDAELLQLWLQQLATQGDKTGPLPEFLMMLSQLFDAIKSNNEQLKQKLIETKSATSDTRSLAESKKVDRLSLEEQQHFEATLFQKAHLPTSHNLAQQKLAAPAFRAASPTSNGPTQPPVSAALTAQQSVRMKEAHQAHERNRSSREEQAVSHTSNRPQPLHTRQEAVAVLEQPLRFQKEEEPTSRSKLKERQEREGGEGKKEQRDDSDASTESEEERVEEVQAAARKKAHNLLEALNQFGEEEAPHFSELLEMPISHFDILILIIEILKLEIRTREQEWIYRQQERALQLEHMQQVVENYKDQASKLMWAHLGAGITGVLAGLFPIIGHMKGDWLIEKLGGIPFLDKIRDMDKDTFIKAGTKLLDQCSKTSRAMGDVQHMAAESGRTYSQHMSDLYRTDWEETTRALEKIKEDWRAMEEFLLRLLQMRHETALKLYQ